MKGNLTRCWLYLSCFSFNSFNAEHAREGFACGSTHAEVRRGYNSPPSPLKQFLSLSPELAILASLASLLAPGIPCLQLPHAWITGRRHVWHLHGHRDPQCFVFHIFLMLAWQMLYPQGDISPFLTLFSESVGEKSHNPYCTGLL